MAVPLLIPVIIEVSLCVWCVHACKCTTVLLFSYWSLARYPCVVRGVWGAGEGGCLFRHRVMTTARPLPPPPPILVMMPQSARHLGGDSPLGQAVGGVEPGTALQTPLSCVCAEKAWRAGWDQRGHPPPPELGCGEDGGGSGGFGEGHQHLLG